MSFQSETTTVASNEQAPLLPKTQRNDPYNNNDDDNDDTYLINQPRKYKVVALLCAVFLAGNVFWMHLILSDLTHFTHDSVGSHFAAHTLGAMKNIVKEVSVLPSCCNPFLFMMYMHRLPDVGFWYIQFPIWCHSIQRLHREYGASCFWWYRS